MQPLAGREDSRPSKQRQEVNAVDRFEKYVSPEPMSGCWLWIGTASNGYGRFWTGIRQVQAHRFSYEQANGSIPVGLVVDHLCRNPSCVNPTHLEAVSNRENVLRGIGLPAIAIKKTACPRGHEYSGENLTRTKMGHRVCLTCTAARARRYYRMNIEKEAVRSAKRHLKRIAAKGAK